MANNKLISQKGKKFHFDVIVVGSGIAGLIYVLELSKIIPDCSIALMTKGTLKESNSYYAQGGIAAVSMPEDSVENHTRDTLKAGDGLSDESVVNDILSFAPDAIKLLKQYGVCFDENNLAKEAGHSHRRIYHAGDVTGRAVIDALVQSLSSLKNITLFEGHVAVNLITQNKKHIPGSIPEVVGAYVLEMAENKVHTFIAKTVVLATGGAGKVYRYTSNIKGTTGDGIAMAARAGARIGNMEFYQFHPTLFYHMELNNFLISEAVRGEGAYLCHPATLERFMKNYAENEMELATRDIVSRAIFNEIERSNVDYVYLDISHKTKEFLKKRFPTIFDTLLKYGYSMDSDLIPVVPGAHYLCGGILSDVYGRTDIKRLYAIGECAFTGLHGTNRLASNSLLEAVVMAHYAAGDTLNWIKSDLEYDDISDWDSKSVVDLRRASQINAHWRGLRGEMMSYAGIIRTEHGLNDLLKLVQARQIMIDDYYWTHPVTRDFVELRNIVLIAELIIRCALKRHESRGGHYREDCPKKQKNPKETILRYAHSELVFE